MLLSALIQNSRVLIVVEGMMSKGTPYSFASNLEIKLQQNIQKLPNDDDTNFCSLFWHALPAAPGVTTPYDGRSVCFQTVLPGW